MRYSCKNITCRCDAACARAVLLCILLAFVVISFLTTILVKLTFRLPNLANIDILMDLWSASVFQILIGIIGLIGVWFSNQRILYLFILSMFPLFLVLFSVSCSILKSDNYQQETILEAAWHRASGQFRGEVQADFDCCGFRDASQVEEPLGHPPCARLKCCAEKHSAHACCAANATVAVVEASRDGTCPCTKTCLAVTRQKFNLAIKVNGTVGLLTAIFDIVGIFLAIKYRDLLYQRAEYTKLF